MKRIINGVTYNTSTAVKIAYSRKRHGQYDQITMYQTRRGAFFFCLHGPEEQEGVVQIDSEDPGKFLEHADEVYIDTLNSSPPQAQQEAAIFVRAPQSLKRSVEQAAQDQGVSVNHLAVRCLEKCLPKAES